MIRAPALWWVSGRLLYRRRCCSGASRSRTCQRTASHSHFVSAETQRSELPHSIVPPQSSPLSKFLSEVTSYGCCWRTGRNFSVCRSSILALIWCVSTRTKHTGSACSSQPVQMSYQDDSRIANHGLVWARLGRSVTTVRYGLVNILMIRRNLYQI